ncbi:MAG TPA: phosphate-starvation-inducible PsiE family protein [Candidatus Micrarchaeaceae archaeon]|nr:phosphate-starvation-inducible PsiE family protein [Candidatus Micrarchaeaceae archaeon]
MTTPPDSEGTPGNPGQPRHQTSYVRSLVTTRAPNRWKSALTTTPLRRAGDAVQYGVAVVLLLIAMVVLIRTTIDFLTSQSSYPQSLVSAIDGVLIVIIVVDVLRTVLTHFEGSGFPLRPFLIIGIISAVRDILSVSARLALQGPVSGAGFERLAIELGVSSAVALALTGALVLTRVSEASAAAES